MIAAGVGCRRGAPAHDVEAAIRTALARAQLAAGALDVIATSEAKQAETGIRATAAAMAVALVGVQQADLARAGERVQTRSERVLAVAGVGSVAEAAALAAAGPSATLIVPRLVVGSATCALAASPLAGAGP